MNKLTLSQLSKKNLDKIQQRTIKGGCDGEVSDGCNCCDCVGDASRSMLKEALIKIGNW